MKSVMKLESGFFLDAKHLFDPLILPDIFPVSFVPGILHLVCRMVMLLKFPDLIHRKAVQDGSMAQLVL